MNKLRTKYQVVLRPRKQKSWGDLCTLGWFRTGWFPIRPMQPLSVYRQCAKPIEVETKWPPFCKRHFNAFWTKRSIFFVQNPLMFLQYGSNCQYLINGSDNDLVPQGWQAIAWTNDHPVHNTSVTRLHFVKAASLTMIRVIGQSNHGSTIRRINTLFLTWLKFDLSMDKYIHYNV